MQTLHTILHAVEAILWRISRLSNRFACLDHCIHLHHQAIDIPIALTFFSLRCQEQPENPISVKPIAPWEGSRKQSGRKQLLRRDRKHHDSQRCDRILRMLLRPDIGQFSPHFGAISSRNCTEKLHKGKKSTGENLKDPMETAPQNCRFLSLVVVECVLILRKDEWKEIHKNKENQIRIGARGSQATLACGRMENCDQNCRRWMQ